MHCLTHNVVQLRVGLVLTEAKSISVSTRKFCVTMRDRSKNRKQLQRGRFLSSEAIQTIQALKRAANNPGTSLGNEFNSKFRRLLKLDMIAVLRELLRQNQCDLALKVCSQSISCSEVNIYCVLSLGLLMNKYSCL